MHEVFPSLVTLTLPIHELPNIAIQTEEVIKNKLCDAGLNDNEADYYSHFKEGMIYKAVERDAPNIIEKAASIGFNVNYLMPNHEAASPLELAIKKQSPLLVKALLSVGANANETTKDGLLLVSLAINCTQDPNHEIIKLMFYNKIEPFKNSAAEIIGTSPHAEEILQIFNAIEKQLREINKIQSICSQIHDIPKHYSKKLGHRRQEIVNALITKAHESENKIKNILDKYNEESKSEQVLADLKATVLNAIANINADHIENQLSPVRALKNIAPGLYPESTLSNLLIAIDLNDDTLFSSNPQPTLAFTSSASATGSTTQKEITEEAITQDSSTGRSNFNTTSAFSSSQTTRSAGKTEFTP